MNCDDYLSMLSTLPVEELEYGRAREHCDSCRDCDRVTRVVAERERNMRLAFVNLSSSVPAAQTTSSAMSISRRRRIARYYQIGLVIATLVTALYMFVVARTVDTPAPASMVVERIRLSCLSPEQAAELVRAQIGETSRITLRSDSPEGILHVEASPAVMETALSLIERHDSPAQSQCAVKVPVPKGP